MGLKYSLFCCTGGLCRPIKVMDYLLENLTVRVNSSEMVQFEMVSKRFLKQEFAHLGYSLLTIDTVVQ